MLGEQDRRDQEHRNAQIKNHQGALPEWSELANALGAHDEEKIRGCQEDIDSLLTFAGLFSAAVTAFNIESYQNLQQDSGDLTASILIHVSEQLVNMSAPADTSQPVTNVAYTTPPFSPPPSAVRTNVLWFVSLTVSLFAASLSLLAKQWLGEYTRSSGKHSTPEEYIRIRYARYGGLKRWHVFEIVALLPVLLHTAMILFFFGLGEFLLNINSIVGALVTTCVAGWLFLFGITTIAPALSPDCPYVTPLVQPSIRTVRYVVW
ncbi:hypothetical protein BDW22DRAFT_1338789, partial [Trametopsis cervina]